MGKKWYMGVLIADHVGCQDNIIEEVLPVAVCGSTMEPSVPSQASDEVTEALEVSSEISDKDAVGLSESELDAVIPTVQVKKKSKKKQS